MEVECELDAFAEFLTKYPAYKDTMIIDSLRQEEYWHLDEKGQVCLDYTGVGLFSGSQIGQIGIEYSHTSSNLATHAMYPEEGSTENHFRKRVLHYLNLDEEDYYIVFTANAFSAFKLLGTSYPFHEAPHLLLAYDHKCENVDAISECCLLKSAFVHSVALSRPWYRVDSSDLKKKLHCRRKVSTKKGVRHKGLFAFPYASRVTGYRSCSSWIPQARRNGWHVLLDLTSIDAKILDSLGLSVLLPDFVICSFYNVFGEDPTGLGCLAVKKSVIRTLGDSSRAQAIGMVTVINKQPSVPIESHDCTCVDDHDNDNRVACLPLDYSVDQTTLDNSLLYQWNGDDHERLKGVQDDVVSEGNFLQHGWSDDDIICQGKQEKDLLIHNEVLDHAGNTLVTCDRKSGGSTSFSRWMGNQLVHSVSLRSISIPQTDQDGFDFARTYELARTGSTGQNGASEIQELEHSTSDNNFTKIMGQTRSTQKRNLKGLSCSDATNLYSTNHVSLRRLFKYETKAKIREHLHKAGQLYGGEVLTVHNWMDYYAEKSRVMNCASSSESSSFQFAMEDADFQEADRQAKIASLHSKIVCKGLDHADVLGYRRVAVRLRLLAEWLISALLSLQHPPPMCTKLVKFCSQGSLKECVSTVAFNLADTSGKPFDVKRVQLLADRNNISIRVGIIEGTCTSASQMEEPEHGERSAGCMELSSYKRLSRDGSTQRIQMPVLFVSLGFLNNFSDVYRLWRFICRFLDPQFVRQELWQYQALNQETIEI